MTGLVLHGDAGATRSRATLREAGFDGVEVRPIEQDFLRFSRLDR